MTEKFILAACIGDCIHTAGILGFLNISNQLNFESVFLGPATSIEKIIEQIKITSAPIVGISYRLTAENGYNIILKFIKSVKKEHLENRKFLLGCLPKLASKIVENELNFFEKIFIGGESIKEIIPVLKNTEDKNEISDQSSQIFPDNLIQRIKYNHPFPIIRAHFGLPSLRSTMEGIDILAKSNLLDVISIAPDQTAQEWLQRPKVLNNKPSGAGGVPIRSKSDLTEICKRSRKGNYPLLRIYSGTQDLVQNAEIFQNTIHNAWAAIPIFWYSELDGRGPLELKDAIKEHLRAIKWHADRNIPVEVNDPHQWGLRMAPDYLVVADAYLSALIAKKLGVKYYIEQLMFNTPNGVSFKMDLARVLAMIEIIEPLIDENFSVYRETRAGLEYFSLDPTIAKGQLVASTIYQMMVKPHIVHVVSYCEAEHAASPEDIIESCKLLKKVIEDSTQDVLDLTRDNEIQDRKNKLLEKAKNLLRKFENIAEKFGETDPYLSVLCLTESVKSGLFDAPQLIGNPIAKGKIRTGIIDGKCEQITNEIIENNPNMLRISKIRKVIGQPKDSI